MAKFFERVRKMFESDVLVEAIREGEIVRMPESQAIEEDLFILRRIVEPENEYVDLAKHTKKTPVQEWKEEHAINEAYSKLNNWKVGKISGGTNKVKNSLIENFHWKIMRERRRRDMSRRKLADLIEITEDELKIVEMGDLPRDDFVIIAKIENQLGIILRKDIKPVGPSLHELQKANEFREIKKESEKVVKERVKDSSIFGNEIEVID